MKNQTGSWADLVGRGDGEEWLELCSAALVEVQEETTRRLGRECLRDGLSAFLPRLVGPENAERVAKDW
jgi:hypothetical protein